MVANGSVWEALIDELTFQIRTPSVVKTLLILLESGCIASLALLNVLNSSRTRRRSAYEAWHGAENSSG